MRWLGAVALYAALGGVLYVAGAWGRAGTTFIGAPYTDNENVNNAIKTIDDVMCGGLPPLAPCQLPPTASLHVLGPLTVDGALTVGGALSFTNMTVSGTATIGTVSTQTITSGVAPLSITGTPGQLFGTWNVEGGAFRMFHAPTDAQPVWQLDNTGTVTVGVGGVTAPDTQLSYNNSVPLGPGGLIVATTTNNQAVPLTVGAISGQLQDLLDVKKLPGDQFPVVAVTNTGKIAMGFGGPSADDATITYDNQSTLPILRFNHVAVDGSFWSAGGASFANRAGCTTAAAVGAQCNTNWTWPVALNSNSYEVSCSCLNTTGIPILFINNKLAASMTVTTTAISGVAAQCGEIDCLAIQK